MTSGNVVRVGQRLLPRPTFAALALVYLAAGLFGAKGILTAGILTAFTALQTRLFAPIGALLWVSTQIQASLALFDRIFSYLDLRRDIIEEPGAKALARDQVRGAISLRDVWFRYPATGGTTARRLRAGCRRRFPARGRER